MAAFNMRRRDVLKGLGALLPLSMGLGVRPVLAGTAPKRVIFFFIPDGSIPSLFHPTGSEFSFKLSPMTAALEPVVKDCVFVSGLTMYEGGATHEGGVAKVLTGNNTLSLDVALAQQIGQMTPVSSLYLGIHANYQNGSNYFSFLPGNKARTPEDNPLAAFKSVFGGVGGNGGDAMAASNEKSVLDNSIADLKSLQSRLGSAEKAKLDLHLDALRELEQRIASPRGQAAAASTQGGSCNTDNFNKKEMFSVPENFNGYPPVYNLEETFEVCGQLQQDLAVSALACDMTRIVSIQWSHPVSPTEMKFTGSTQRHHDASHYGNADSDTAKNFIKLQNYYTGRMASLIEDLRSRPDGDGTLLDNTLIFLFSELGDSNVHDHNNMPFVLAGGAGGELSTGRFLSFPQDAHSKLLVSIANAMDVNIDTFGYSGKGKGGLPGLFRS